MTVNEIKALEQYDFLSTKQCEDIVSRVIQNKRHWTARGGGFFWTLGAAAYLDKPVDLYEGHAAECNKVIMAQFPDLLDVMLKFFTQYFKAKTVFHPYAAVPGFHIFDESAGEQQGKKHSDLQFQNIRWPEPFSRVFSFTAVLQLPQKGGGLKVWPVGSEDSIYLPYEVGKIYIHDGRIAHAIANPAAPASGEYRITLQGHGALLEWSKVVVVYF